MLYVTPSSEDPPLGLIDGQSRLSLVSTDTGGNVNQNVSAAKGIPDTLHACNLRLDRSRLPVWGNEDEFALVLLGLLEHPW